MNDIQRLASHAKQSLSTGATDGEVLGASYTPHAGQVRLHAAARRYVTACAGRRAGKTMAAAMEVLTRIYRQIAVDGAPARSENTLFVRRPRRLYWVVAPSYELLREPQRYVFEFLPAAVLAMINAGLVAGWRQQERRLWLPGDVEIVFRSGEDPLALVSAPLDGVWLSEAARLKADVWQFLRPGLTDRRGWVIAETTPLGRNWLYDELWRRGLPGDPLYDPEYASIAWATAENPHIDPAELEQARRDLPAATYRREYEASFAAFAGQIYENVRAEEFDALPYRSVIAGIDWGYAHPGGALVIGVRADGCFDVLAEEYAAGRPLPAWIATFLALRDRWHVRTWYADPSAPMLITEARRAGLVVVAANNDVWDGIARVQALLHGKRLRIHARCVNLLREMEGYRWQRDRREGALREEPVKEADHLCDCLRYSLAEEARGPVWRAL